MKPTEGVCCTHTMTESLNSTEQNNLKIFVNKMKKHDCLYTIAYYFETHKDKQAPANWRKRKLADLKDLIIQQGIYVDADVQLLSYMHENKMMSQVPELLKKVQEAEKKRNDPVKKLRRNLVAERSMEGYYKREIERLNKSKAALDQQLQAIEQLIQQKMAKLVTTRATMHSIKTSINAAEQPFPCPICMEEKPAAEKLVTPCNHEFCIDCFQQLRTTNSYWEVPCPMCRSSVSLLGVL